MKFSVTTILYISIVTALFFPFGQQTKILIPYLLVALMFLSFSTIQLKFRDFLRIEALYFGIISLLILPFLVYHATISLDESLHLGLFLAVIAPPAISSTVIIQIIKGDTNLGLINSIIFSLICPLSISLLLNIYFHDSSFQLPILNILTLLFTIIFIPILLVNFLKHFFPTSLNKIALTSTRITPYLFILITALGIAAARDYIINQSIEKIALTILATSTLALFNYGLGLLFSKKETKRAMMVTSGYKSISLLIGVGTLYFTDSILMVIVLYLIAQQVINGFLLSKFK